MDQFSYLSVLLSIILGLAITQVLKGFRGMLLTRARIRFYWPTFVWSLTLLLFFVQGWWAMFTMRTMTLWTFATFGVILLQTIIYYMLAAIVFPDFFGSETVDLREHYFGHARWFMGLLIALLMTSLLKSYILDGRLPEPTNTGFHLFFFAASLCAALTRREWFHKLQAVAAFLGILAYIFVLFQRLK